MAQRSDQETEVIIDDEPVVSFEVIQSEVTNANGSLSSCDEQSVTSNDQIIRDIEAEIDEKIESISRQSTENSHLNGEGAREMSTCADFEYGSEFDLEPDGRSHEKCPEDEIRFRLEHDLVHKFEMLSGVPDPVLMVKEFRRSSADNNEISKVFIFKRF